MGVKNPKKASSADLKKSRGVTGEPTPAQVQHIAEPLRHLAVRVDTLNLDAANCRKHGAKNHSANLASLRRWGQREAFWVQRAGMVVRVGNDRLKCATELGWEWVAVIVSDDPVSDQAAYAIAHNRGGELGEWDDDVLGAQLAGLDADGFDLDDLGFTDEDLDALPGWGDDDDEGGDDSSDDDYQSAFKIIVECESEQAQRELLERLEGEGYQCQLLML